MAAKTEKPTDAKKVLTPKFRVSFPHVFKAQAMDENSEPKFSVVMLFDKKTDISKLQKAHDLALKEKWGDKPPKGLLNPFKDGSEKELDGYEGMIFVNASSKEQPQVVDQLKHEIMSTKEFYAGCYARATIRAFAWEFKNKQGVVVKRGVSFGLNNIQKLADGEPFSGRTNADSDFDEVDTGEDNPANYSGGKEEVEGMYS